MPEKEIMSNRVEKFKQQVLKLAHEWVWDEILEELAEDCPNYDNCSDNAIENHEPMHDESRD